MKKDKNSPNSSNNSPLSSRSLEENYDEYYKGGKESKYNENRFKSVEVSMSEERTLKNLVFSAVNNGSKKISLFEFGCGDGRFLPAINKISGELSKRNIEFEVMAYDITKVGLEEYGNRIKESFEEQLDAILEADEYQSSNSISIVGIYKFHNTTIKLIKGNIDTKPQEISEFLGQKVDVTSAMFGPLAHIRPKSLRVEFLKMFKDITIGNVAITVPSDGQFKKHQESYNMMRDHGIIEGEVGDINYKVPNTNIINQYHVFNEQELKDSFIDAGYEEKEIEIFASTVYDTATITKNSVNNYYDFALAGIISNLPSGSKSQYSSYLGVMTNISQEKKMQNSLPSTSVAANDLSNISGKDSEKSGRDS